jgi:hypothetical protein
MNGYLRSRKETKEHRTGHWEREKDYRGVGKGSNQYAHQWLLFPERDKEDREQ